jgi:hypothetical protein
MLTETLNGQANKAVVAGFSTAIGAEYVHTLVNWLVQKGTEPIGMPDPVQTALTMIIMGVLGYLVTYAIANKPAPVA